MEPSVELLGLPEGYGTPKRPLAWAPVRERLERSLRYWVATTRPDGRPHVVPRDGVWLDDTWYYGGSDQTVHNRNLEHNRAAVMHLEDGEHAVIVEGDVQTVTPTRQLAERLAEGGAKYAPLGYAPTADSYLAGGVLALRARRVLAWDSLPNDATRFLFPADQPGSG